MQNSFPRIPQQSSNIGDADSKPLLNLRYTSSRIEEDYEDFDRVVSPLRRHLSILLHKIEELYPKGVIERLEEVEKRRPKTLTTLKDEIWNILMNTFETQ